MLEAQLHALQEQKKNVSVRVVARTAEKAQLFREQQRFEERSC